MNNKSRRHPYSAVKHWSVGVLAALVLSACGQSQQTEQQSAANAPTVSVAQVVAEPITEWDEFTGRLQAPQTVTVTPRVSGYIEQVFFTEGAMVKAGDRLLQIDARPFLAEVARLSAELDSAKYALQLANNDLQRAQKLSEQRAISAEILDTRASQQQQASAQVAALKAALERAQLDLAFTDVRAPISGRVSYAQITAGNFVNAGQTALTSIVSTDKMYAYFDVDEQSYLKYLALSQQGKRPSTRDSQRNPVYMALADETRYQHQGYIDFVDNRINQSTGTIRIRATFDNSEQSLLPGLFVRVRLAGSASYDGILIDEKAIATDLNNKYVLVLDKDNHVQYRAVTLGERLQGLRIVSSGLSAGDRVVLNGLQHVQPNMQVQPQPVQMASEQQIKALRQAQQRLQQTHDKLTAQLLSQDKRG
ncbi:efflux RND transporter periplasmic adaptor subunit [Idiomarina xiamenensis]|nr:efflux RND transporter periplasmic adaptor subunit [Idiomarina xiamenensis]